MVILGETLRVVDTVYGTVHGSVCAAGSHRTLVFTPQFPLQPGTCEVEVTTGVSSWFGRVLAQLFRFSFRVGS
ncbi:MAG: Ig-like domain-containing protein [Dethiobacter sp.]